LVPTILIFKTFLSILIEIDVQYIYIYIKIIGQLHISLWLANSSSKNIPFVLSREHSNARKNIVPSLHGVHEMNAYIASCVCFPLHTAFRLTDFNTILYGYFGIIICPRFVLYISWTNLWAIKTLMPLDIGPETVYVSYQVFENMQIY
jgi:hypothetical protein